MAPCRIIAPGRRLWLILFASLMSPASQGAAQAPHPAADGDTTAHPVEVNVVRVPGGYRYVDAKGMTLYMLDAQGAIYRVGGGMNYCTQPACTSQFQPLAAAPDARPVGFWKPASGSSGRQWTYRDSPVFTSTLDRQPGDTAAEFHDDMFLTIPWVPPEPEVTAPPGTKLRYQNGAWFLADSLGRALFTTPATDKCAQGCDIAFRAAMAAHDFGTWQVVGNRGEPQWAYRGRPVFIAATVRDWPDGEAKHPIPASP